jgi:hypothetical protein
LIDWLVGSDMEYWLTERIIDYLDI